ncbi:MAG TPA: acyl-CoA carboxylase subunit beta [Dehalococcoidia bacterium]|nr:acyl-CoA carboxylase subunit beta [Dehalococcoidia bacterium]
MEDLELMKKKIAEINTMRDALKQGGGAAAIEKQHEKGKLTARERIDKLLDPGTFQELDIWGTPLATGFAIDEQESAADGVAVGYGEVNGRPIYIWAQDATVMGGTLGNIHARKITMVMERAIHARIPIVGIIDSEGARIEDAIQYYRFYSTESMVYYQTMASGVIPQISLIMGPCVGEMAISASLADFVFMVRKTSYMHVAPPPEDKTPEELGDPSVHTRKTGCCDLMAKSEEECLESCRQLLGYLPPNNTEPPPIVDTGDDPNRRAEELLQIVPFDAMNPYSMQQIITLISDNGEFLELRRQWANNLITGFIRLAGQTVGIIANNPQAMGGSLTLDAADKMAQFARFCDAFNIPLVWLADTPAFLPAVDEETRGLIRHGCKLVFSNVEATVPQITIAIRKLYGGGQLGMPGTTLGGDLDVAWPTVQRGLMGAEGAVSIIYKREFASIQDEKKRQQQQLKRTGEMQQKFASLEREWAQEFIDPRDTRPFLIKALKTLSKRKEERPQRKHENIRL